VLAAILTHCTLVTQLLPVILLSFAAACIACAQGLGTAVLAAILGSLPKTGGSLADHTVLLSGETRCSATNVIPFQQQIVD
jgi:hypothetical protein